MHRRLLPKSHFLKYDYFQVLIDLQSMPQSKLFSLNCFNLFSFYEKDFGPDKADNSRPLLTRVQEFLGENGAWEIGDRVFLLTMPRFLGFAFNPISIYFIESAHGDLKSIAYEVNNTFGSRHTYVSKIENYEPRFLSDKKLHVSPFMDMDMFYEFRIKKEANAIRLQIQLFNRMKELYLTALQKSDGLEFNDVNLAKIALSMPFMTLGVVWGIHWHALKIILKGIKYRHPPKAAPILDSDA